MPLTISPLHHKGMNYRLLQAAMVVITHLFLNSDGIGMAKNISIHQDLHYAINTFKSFTVTDSGGFFYGQGERLEMLLAASARIKHDKMQHSENSCSLRNRNMWKPFDTNEDDETASLQFPSDDAFSNLDESLMKLTAAYPSGAGESNFEDVWKEIFSVLDTNILPA